MGCDPGDGRLWSTYIDAGVEGYINCAYGVAMSDRTEAVPFELRSLEIFLTVCEAGGMAAAARRLGMTQPAVSLAVAELERKTGATLFDRSIRPITLTSAGGMLRQRASALMAEAREIAPLLRETKHGRVPRIRVGLVDSLSRALTRPLATFLVSRADEVSILSGLTAMHASELLTRRLDLFLGVDDLQDLPGLERWELITEPYVLLLAPGTRPLRTVDDLKRLAQETPLIRYSARSQTGLEVERHLRRLGLEPPRSLEFDTPYGVAAMVAAGGGFAISTPLCVAEAMMPPGSLTTARLPGPQLTRRLTLVTRHRELGSLPRDLASAARRVLVEAGPGGRIPCG
jgi:DNA-binding transcriptional LysR family regulator